MNRQDRSSPLWWNAWLVALLYVLTGCSTSSAEREAPRSSARSASPSASANPQQYVALGDSYTSAPLVPVTDIANGCLRSTGNYPTLAARALGAALDDRSCGGARIRDLNASQFPGVPPQLEALRPSVDLVTIGLGGNDQKVFARLTRRCPALRSSDPAGAPCRDEMNRDGRDSLLSALGRTRGRLAGTLREVHRRAPEAKVLVVGYPQIVDADNRCDLLPLARADYAYVETVNRALTEALRLAALDTGSTYVDVWSASAGHDICSDDPWINGSLTDQKRAAAYHPFAAEQAAVADLVVAAIRG
jgi:lysophospholipase L1-like esterase